MKRWMQKYGDTEVQANVIFQFFDTSGNGMLSVDDYVALFNKFDTKRKYNLLKYCYYINKLNKYEEYRSQLPNWNDRMSASYMYVPMLLNSACAARHLVNNTDDDGVESDAKNVIFDHLFVIIHYTNKLVI